MFLSDYIITQLLFSFLKIYFSIVSSAITVIFNSHQVQLSILIVTVIFSFPATFVCSITTSIIIISSSFPFYCTLSLIFFVILPFFSISSSLFRYYHIYHLPLYSWFNIIKTNINITKPSTSFISFPFTFSSFLKYHYDNHK